MALDQYELLEPIGQDEERKSYKARDITTSRNVIVHALQSRDLAALASSLSNRGVAGLVFAGEREGTFYVVTEWRAECRDIRAWLQSHSSGDPLSRAGLWKVPVSKAASAPEPGEFTRMFQTPSGESEPAPVFQQPPPSEAGEFTRMFSVSPPDASPAKPPVSEKGANEPGDFTRMFQAPPVQPPSAPAESARTEPGELTRLFTAAPQPTPPKEEAPLSFPVAPVSETPSIAVPANPVIAGSTGIFASPAPPNPAPVEPQPAGPSDFTRVIAIPATPPAETQIPNTPPAVPSPLDPVVAPSYLPLILILNGLFLIAVLLVLYFVLKE